MLGAYIVFGGLTALFAYLFYDIHSTNNWKNRRIKILEERIKQREVEIFSLKDKIIGLEFSNSQKSAQREYDCNKGKIIIPPDTIRAVKYAMKHAHPDNGGNAEDFIRFQKCYEELTRK